LFFIKNEATTHCIKPCAMLPLLKYVHLK
jgi:hypothetical protein